MQRKVCVTSFAMQVRFLFILFFCFYLWRGSTKSLEKLALTWTLNFNRHKTFIHYGGYLIIRQKLFMKYLYL